MDIKDGKVEVWAIDIDAYQRTICALMGGDWDEMLKEVSVKEQPTKLREFLIFVNNKIPSPMTEEMKASAEHALSVIQKIR